MSLVQFGFHLNFGNTNVSRLFDGEPDHLTPSTSQTLLESDMFLVAASCEQRKALLKFWTGWEVLPGEMSVEVVNSQSFPKSSTCFEVLRIPARYQNYESFFVDMQACLASINTGFGLV
ncbi:hypothetical protein FQA47_017976 [Oryzias melastigma]|uniref:HECT domain-containing protein n=1 Tax=Oryzias melastigma TaxID=30732 RepID=A0A834EUP5_ORYME|nr:hypothetical protein FQA47_021627 [Oryzias melastigma]KAF6732152.1 hypothetical protein FQA47_017976 [Oryzias melastigma]